MGYIYVITNDINDKQYVGKMVGTLEERWRIHLKDSKTRVAEKRPLYDAMNKYGIEHFSIEQLEECSYENLSEREQYWIKKLNTYRDGYNATLGGDGKLLYDYKELANKYLELGTINATAKFFGCDTDTVSRACKECGVKILTGQEYNKKNFSKKVGQIDLQTGKIIAVYDSITDAAKAVNGNHGSLSRVCRGLRKTAKGFGWQFI